MWTILAGALMGWSLGANDAANIFGPMVGSGAIRFWKAAVLSSVFILVGAILFGARGFATYGAIGSQTLLSAFLTMLAAGLTVTIMTLLGLPVSSTQAVVGAIIGWGLVAGDVAFAPLGKIFLSWVLTPLGGLVASYLPYRLLSRYPNTLPARWVARARVVRIAMTVVMCYSAFSLGANNVANVTGVFVGAGLLTPLMAALFGAATIALGILTFSKRVIQTVGNRIVALDPDSALVVVLAEALTLNIFAMLGIPVSASQAVVGAVLGIGLVKGVQTVDARVLRRVLFGWLGTPALAAIVSATFSLISATFYS